MFFLLILCVFNEGFSNSEYMKPTDVMINE